MIKNNIFIIVLIIAMLVVLSLSKFTVRLDLDISADRAEEIIFDCPMILNTAIEYEDAHTKIIGGRLPILPSISGINIQAAIREADGECRVTIGYPALPLESY